MVGNQADGQGAALATTHGVSVELTNTLVINNTGETGIADRDGSGSTITLSYCDTYGNSPDGADGVTIARSNCLGAPPEDGLDPLLVGGALPTGTGPAFADQWLAYDYRLQKDSPAIDAGTNDGAPDHDLDEMPRPMDGNGDGEAITDMGAYEFVRYRISLPIILTDWIIPGSGAARLNASGPGIRLLFNP